MKYDSAHLRKLALINCLLMAGKLHQAPMIEQSALEDVWPDGHGNLDARTMLQDIEFFAMQYRRHGSVSFA